MTQIWSFFKKYDVFGLSENKSKLNKNNIKKNKHEVNYFLKLIKRNINYNNKSEINEEINLLNKNIPSSYISWLKAIRYISKVKQAFNIYADALKYPYDNTKIKELSNLNNKLGIDKKIEQYIKKEKEFINDRDNLINILMLNKNTLDNIVLSKTKQNKTNGFKKNNKKSFLENKNGYYNLKDHLYNLNRELSNYVKNKSTIESIINNFGINSKTSDRDNIGYLDFILNIDKYHYDLLFEYASAIKVFSALNEMSPHGEVTTKTVTNTIAKLNKISKDKNIKRSKSYYLITNYFSKSKIYKIKTSLELSTEIKINFNESFEINPKIKYFVENPVYDLINIMGHIVKHKDKNFAIFYSKIKRKDPHVLHKITNYLKKNKILNSQEELTEDPILKIEAYYNKK